MLKGKAFRLGDDVDTDVIIPGRYLTTSDPEALKPHCLEDLDPSFAARVQPGDVIVAGVNFGCGSSREHAPLCLKASGISVVIAKSFGRIFFRNAFNIGLPILESAAAAAGIEAGDELEVDLSTGAIKNLTRGTEFQAQAAPPFMQELIADGGLIGHIKKRLVDGKIAPDAKTAAGKEAGPKKRRGARAAELEAASAAEPRGADAPWETDAPPPEQPADPMEEEEEEEEEEPETK